MEKTVGTHALRTVTIKHVTGSMDGVFGVVKMDFMVKCVKEVIISLYYTFIIDSDTSHFFVWLCYVRILLCLHLLKDRSK